MDNKKRIEINIAFYQETSTDGRVNLFEGNLDLIDGP